MTDSPQTIVPLEQVEENLVKLTLTIDPADFEKGLQHSYLKNRNKIMMPGFRKGRAPRKMIEVQYGKEFFYEDALDFVFPDAYKAAIKQHDLDVVSTPQADIDIQDDKVLIHVEVYTRPLAEIDGYKGLKYIDPDREVTEEEVNAEFDREREKNSRITTIADRAAIDGDIAVIDFEGFIDDEPFAGGKGENFELTLGSNSFIDTFEAQIVGKSPGDAFDVNVTFPDEYHAEELAGQPAVFKVTLHEIKQKELPEADDDFAQEVSEFDTFAEYAASIRQNISDRKNESAEVDIENQLVKTLSEMIEVNIPAPMLDMETDRILRDFANRVQSQGFDFGRYMQMMNTDLNGMRGLYKEQARQTLMCRLAVEAVARKENVEVSDDDYNAELDRLAEMYGIERERLAETIGEDEKDGIIADLKVKKAVEIVRAAAVAGEAEEVAEEENAG